MARSAQTDLFVARLLAMAFAALSACPLLFRSMTWETMIALTGGCAALSIGVLAGVRARVGWRGTYSHPLTKITVVLLVPAFLLMLTGAIALAVRTLSANESLQRTAGLSFSQIVA
jgi:hypothetical protein